MTKRAEEYGEMREFTAKVKRELDWVYASIFASFKRISDKERYKRNDKIAIEAKTHSGGTITIHEKFMHNRENLLCDFEVMHLDARGNFVVGEGLKSAADIIIYAVWDDNEEKLSRIIVLNEKLLKRDAKKDWDEYFKKTITRRIACDTRITKIKGSNLQTGVPFTAYAYRFHPDKLDDSFYIKYKGKRIEV